MLQLHYVRVEICQVDETPFVLKMRYNFQILDGLQDGLDQSPERLEKGIQMAKLNYKQCIEKQFNYNNPNSMLKGIKTIMDYKGRDQQINQDPSLLSTLNTFFACFNNPSS